jgi:hypothetical protein
MSSRIRVWVALCCFALAVGCVTQERNPAASAAGITAEVQYRPSIDSASAYVPINLPPVSYNGQDMPLGKPTGRFPILEAFITNHREQPVEFARVFLSREELKLFPNDKIVWWQFYPTGAPKPAETVLLQICFDRNPATSQVLELET